MESSKPVADEIIIEDLNKKPEPKSEISNVSQESKPQEEKPKENKDEDKIIKQIHVSILKELRQNYDLSLFSNAQIISAIEKAKGNPEDVFLHLFA